MPWRGPQEAGEFPTLGWLIGEWIEEHCIIPDGPRRGESYELTGEMWQHLLHVYRLDPRAKVHPKYPRPVDGLRHYGSQLRRSQKWGKDPFVATKAIAHSLGPVQWDGWDAAGEPVGRPVDTPWVQVAATSEDQTDNTWRPLVRMLREGPLANTPGLDLGDTRVKLPEGDGWIEPVTAAATSRLGNPITYATLTETHLMTRRSGGKGGGAAMAKAMKRNLAGMGGSWSEVTNAWDPSEDSVAQTTAAAKAPGVYLDHRAPDLPRLTPEEFADDQVVLERIVVKYGDSCRRAGGWVDEHAILATVRDSSTGEGEARRYFLDEVTVGERDAVDATRWDALARPPAEDGGLEAGTPVVLGFDGSRARDTTALIAIRISDGRWFRIGVWKPEEYRTPDEVDADLPGRVPEGEVEQALDDAEAAYDVWYLIADPYRWQHVLDRKAGAWGDNRAGKPRVVDFPTNVERRMDEAITRWQTAYRAGETEFTHDGDRDVTEHAKNAAIANGGRRPPREDEDSQVTEHYQRVVKKKPGWHIDGFVAGLIGTWGRGLAIEHGALLVEEEVEPWAMFT